MARHEIDQKATLINTVLLPFLSWSVQAKCLLTRWSSKEWPTAATITTAVFRSAQAK